jgi:hypothetical protein
MKPGCSIYVNRNPERVLGNANNYFVPAHNFATVKRFPLFTFLEHGRRRRKKTHPISADIL